MHFTLILIFFLSGASALTFETIWFRLVGLTLGNSIWSVSLVLAAFMGGLALGNGLVARMHHRVRRPVRLYAALECAIGVGGIAVVLLLRHLPGELGPILGSITENQVLLNSVRLMVAFVILLVPTIAMGATLPVLAQALSIRDSNFGATIGQLYGWNTLGATLAALGSELVLVPAFGILDTALIAMTLNLVAAVVALRLAERYETVPVSSAAAANTETRMTMRCRRLLVVAFLSGCLMLALEVVWFRFLLLSRDGTSLIFAVMLAVVLAGIAVGGLVASRLFRREDRAYRWLPHAVWASAALVVLTYRGYDVFAVYRHVVDESTVEFIGLAAFLMFPVAAISGVVFTMVNRAVKDQLGSSTRTAGIVTLYNTLGGVLGPLIAGFILLPNAGMELSFFFIALTYCAAAFVVPPEVRQPRQFGLSRLGALAVAIVCLATFPFGLMARTYFGPHAAWLPDHELVAVREGLLETIRYYRKSIYDEPKYYRLVTNGFSMSSTNVSGKRYMKLYVYLPLALKPDIRDTLLVSYGVGSTAKALTDSPGLRSIDIVDISRDILDMSTIVHPGDDDPLRDQRVHVHIEDGRFFLNTTDKHFDLITSEPPPPKLAGVVNLYSQEYFELIRDRLNAGGFVSYWLPAYQLEPRETLAVIRAFCNAFDDCSLWSGAGLDWMLLGSNGANSRGDAKGFSAQWQVPVVRRELVALGFETPVQLGSLFIADSDFLLKLTDGIQPLQDNYPERISWRRKLKRHVKLYGNMIDEGGRLKRFRHSELIARLWPVKLRGESEGYFYYERMIENHFTAGAYARKDDPTPWEAIDDVLSKTSLTTLPLWLLGSDQDTQDIVGHRVAQEDYRPELALELARKYASERDFKTALTYLDIYYAKSRDIPVEVVEFRLYLLARNDMFEETGPIMAKLHALEVPAIDEFLDWYAARFDPQPKSGS